MVKDGSSQKEPQISLAPNEVLFNVASTLNGHVNDLACEMDCHTTCNEAISHVQLALANQDRPLTLFHPRTWQQRQRLRDLALSMRDTTEPLGPLRIRHAIPADQLPSPRRAAPTERRALKERFMREIAALKKLDQATNDPDRPHTLLGVREAAITGQPASPKGAILEGRGGLKENFTAEVSTKKAPDMTKASCELQGSATVPGEIQLHALDWDGGPIVKIRSDACVWDTGAQYCAVSADVVTGLDPSFLNLKMHNPFRTHSRIAVQGDAIFSMSNTTFEISTVFLILPIDDMPNKRTGIVLGQYGLMDRMVVETIPRSILSKRKQETEETTWGEIRVKAVLKLDGELEEFDQSIPYPSAK